MAENIAVIEWEDTTYREAEWKSTRTADTGKAEWTAVAKVTRVSGKYGMCTDGMENIESYNIYDQGRAGTDYAAYGLDGPLITVECSFELRDKTGNRYSYGYDSIGWSVLADPSNMKCTYSDDPAWKNTKIGHNYYMTLGGSWLGYGGQNLNVRIIEDGTTIYDGGVYGMFDSYPIIDGTEQHVWGIAKYIFTQLEGDKWRYEAATNTRVSFGFGATDGDFWDYKLNTPYRFEFYCPTATLMNGKEWIPTLIETNRTLKRLEPIGGGFAIATYTDGSMGTYTKGGGMWWPLDGRSAGVIRTDAHPLAINNGNTGLWTGEWYEF